MNDRDCLAADLDAALPNLFDGSTGLDPRNAAEHLIALGWTRLDVLAPVVTVEGPEEDGSYGVSIVAMPGHVGCGMTIAEAAVEAADAAEAWVAACRDIDEERLARALNSYEPEPRLGRLWTRPDPRDAAAIAKAYRDDHE